MTETLGQAGNGLARQEQTAPPVPAKEGRWSAGVGQRGIVLSNFSDLWKMSQAIAASGLAPKGMQRAETLFVALEMGLEVGLAPMAAIRSIAVINGRPAIYGDAALALVRASGFLESFEERIEGQGDARRAMCLSKRKGMPAPRVTTFSVADAKAAHLWAKDGPWKQYPDRMLQFRARGFNLRDEFGDVLNGMVTVEEAQDIPVETSAAIPAKPRQRGVAGLVNRITTRPVSENQTFEPDPAAVAQAEAEEQAADPLGAGALTESAAEPQEPGTRGVEAEPTTDAVPSPAEAFWITVREACEASGIDYETAGKAGVGKWALAKDVEGREHEAPEPDRTELIAAIGKRRKWFT